MDNNLQDLMNAANQKLEKQKQLDAKEAAGGDIYAEMRAEMQNETSGPSINYQQGGVMPPEYGIQYQGIPEEDIDMGNMEPIFEDGPSIAQVNLWKKQFSKEKVMHTKILDRDFIFRTLNRFEYKQIVAVENIDALYREELICQTCVLWPIAYNFQKMAEEDSGYPSTLAQIIMENSGFTKEYGIEVL